MAFLGESRNVASDRLPGGIIPYHYDIEIAPDIYQDPDEASIGPVTTSEVPVSTTGPVKNVEPPFNFTGQVAIFVKCNVTRNTITLQSKDLTITDLTVELDPNSPERTPPRLTVSDHLHWLL